MTITVRHELAKMWSAVRTILKAPLDVSDSLRDFDRKLRRDQVKRELADAEEQRKPDDLRFCPRCAARLEIRNVGTPASPHPTCISCGFVVWQNIKPSVEALVVRGEGGLTEVLLGRRRGATGEELWDMPGGFLNANDRLHDALQRECLREMGIEIRIQDLLGVFEDEFAGSRIICVVFICGILSGEPRGADIIDAVEWFSLRDEPAVASPAVGEAIAAMRTRAGV